MKKLFLLFSLVLMAHFSFAQCNVIVEPNTIKLPNDTTIVSPNGGSSLNETYLPCTALQFDSTSTVQNKIYLRPGTRLTIDSTSVTFGGYFIYADSGATVDMNFKSNLELLYTDGTILIDTNAQSAASYCANLTFDFSQMIANPNCLALSINKIQALENIMIADRAIDWHIKFPSSKKQIQWNLYSVDGKLIKTGFTNSQEIYIDKSDLHKNMYLLQMQQGYSRKVIKLLHY